jgi:hypothetical protein
MRILRIGLKGFGKHRELNLELAPGFTIIRGPNEAGKSTIQRGIELALFRKATATGTELDTLRTWGSTEEAHASTRLEFVVDDENEETGELVVRHGVLEKEFRGQRGRVSLEYDGKTYTDPAQADQIIAELTGIPNEASSGPPPRSATRSSTTWTATRARSETGSRAASAAATRAARGPSPVSRRRFARSSRAATRTPAASRSRKRPWRAPRRRFAAARPRWRSWNTIATRWPRLAPAAFAPSRP